MRDFRRYQREAPRNRVAEAEKAVYEEDAMTIEEMLDKLGESYDIEIRYRGTRDIDAHVQMILTDSARAATVGSKFVTRGKTLHEAVLKAFHGDTVKL
jgi:hypothetical protein